MADHRPRRTPGRPGSGRSAGWRDDRGAVLALGAVGLTVAIGSAALASDFAYLHLLRREFQKAADGAALSAALALPDAEDTQAAARLSVDTAFADDPPAMSVALGAYRPGTGDDRVTPASGRFLAGVGTGEAVRVELAATRRTLIGAFLGRPTAQITASAVAIGADPSVSLRLSSGLATADSSRSPILDAVFGGLLGGSVALSAGTWQGLADAEVALLDYLDALAVEAGATVGDTASLLAADLSVRSLLSVAADVARDGDDPDGPLAADALDALAAATDPAVTVTVGDVIALDPDAAPPATGSPVVLGTVLLAATLAEAVSARTGLAALPGTLDLGPATATLDVVATETPRVVHRGGVGAFVRTARTRALMTVDADVTVGAGLGLGTIALEVPIYLELGGGRVEVADIVCTGDRAVDLRARSAAADLFAADIDRGDAFGSDPLAPGPVTIATVDLAGIDVIALDLYGHLPVASGERTVTLEGPFDAPRTVRIETSGVVGAPGDALLSTLELDARVLPGLPFPQVVVDALLGDVTAALDDILGAVTAVLAVAVDPVVDTLVDALGADLGYADVDILGVDCARARLVA